MEIHESRPVSLAPGGKILANLSLLALAGTVLLSMATQTAGLYVPAAVLGFVTIRAGWLFLIDLRHRLIPDIIVLPTLAAVLGAYLLLAATTGQWGSLMRFLLGCMAAGGIYCLMAYFGSLGRGDIKLGLLLGGVLAWYSWPAWTAGLILPPFIAAAVALIALARGASKRTHLAYGPAMVLGSACALVIALCI
ncbi:prepilin peptidase [Arthrobacter cryoconiti]|uniref:Prepilin peptidase n=1 Tax=Arthrobacter cryoconiti TaxID=748907 RepID=A0ABV8R4W1_9MICC|nr:prepilin peptidase [Arthrobacter cryoconiti]MCC9069362.1 prepilin peptidase [Arthrobacter cryoconiti]